jgi:uncharacterized protein (TIGR02118 family)
VSRWRPGRPGLRRGEFVASGYCSLVRRFKSSAESHYSNAAYLRFKFGNVVRVGEFSLEFRHGTRAEGGKEFDDESEKEKQMSEAKLIVIYPRPTNIEAFEKIYLEEHVPLAVAKLIGKTKIVATKITSSPQGTPPFYRLAEIHFPSKAALEACAATLGAQEALAHAVKISTGGTPLF